MKNMTFSQIFFYDLLMVSQQNFLDPRTWPEVTAGFIGKYFCPGNGENGPKLGFFNSLEILLIHFF